jgi:hypothetical protein
MSFLWRNVSELSSSYSEILWSDSFEFSHRTHSRMRRFWVLETFYSLEAENWLQTKLFSHFRSPFRPVSDILWHSTLAPSRYVYCRFSNWSENVHTVKLCKVLSVATVMDKATHTYDSGRFQ